MRDEKCGRYACQLSHDGTRCPFEVEARPKSRCGFKWSGMPCWRPSGKVIDRMTNHVVLHGLVDPIGLMARPPKQWRTSLYSTEGVLDVLLCFPCNASRQLMATRGWEDTLDVIACCKYAIPACGLVEVDLPFSWCCGLCCEWDEFYLCWMIPPCWLIAEETRSLVVKLSMINESRFNHFFAVLFCPICSIAQTHRELSYAGVWPGGLLVGSRPSYCGSQVLPRFEECASAPVDDVML